MPVGKEDIGKIGFMIACAILLYVIVSNGISYYKSTFISKDGRYIPDGIEGYVPIQVTNNLMIKINELITCESAQGLVDNPKVAFSIVAKPSYIK